MRRRSDARGAGRPGKDVHGARRGRAPGHSANHRRRSRLTPRHVDRGDGGVRGSRCARHARSAQSRHRTARRSRARDRGRVAPAAEPRRATVRLGRGALRAIAGSARDRDARPECAQRPRGTARALSRARGVVAERRRHRPPRRARRTRRCGRNPLPLRPARRDAPDGRRLHRRVARLVATHSRDGRIDSHVSAPLWSRASMDVESRRAGRRARAAPRSRGGAHQCARDRSAADARRARGLDVVRRSAAARVSGDRRARRRVGKWRDHGAADGGAGAPARDRVSARAPSSRAESRRRSRRRNSNDSTSPPGRTGHRLLSLRRDGSRALVATRSRRGSRGADRSGCAGGRRSIELQATTVLARRRAPSESSCSSRPMY